MRGKKMVIIAIALIAAVLLIYFLFFNDKPEEDGLPSNFNQGRDSSKRNKNNKNANSSNAKSINGTAAQSDTVQNSQESDSRSFQALTSQDQSSGYFKSNSILQPSQIDGRVGTNGVGDGSSGGGPSSGSNTPSGGGGSGNYGSGSSSAYAARLQACVFALQPVLDAKSTDTTTITNALLNVMGFSMLPVAAQNDHINSVAKQSKGSSATNYCKILLQTINPQGIDVASLYTRCETMVRELYSQKGSKITEADAINAFASLGITNGATTSEQQKIVLQKYLGGEYSTIMTTLSNINQMALPSQIQAICSKMSSGIVNAVNDSSAYLSCITTATSAKASNITNVATALPSYANLTVANQQLMTLHYKEFLAGTKTVESLCAFLSKNATVVQSAGAATLSGMVLPSSVDINAICGTVVNSIKSEYDNYILNPDVDYVTNVVNAIAPYEFFISNENKLSVVKYFITQNITNPRFNTLAAANKDAVARRLYETNYSLSAFSNPSIAGVYRELFPQLCKCTHKDYDDMAWKDGIVNYMLLKQSGSTPIPTNIIQKSALITTNPFYQSCSKNIRSKFAITPATTTKEIVTIIQSMNSIFKDIDAIVAPLSCYATNKCTETICPQSCLLTLDDTCQKLTIELLKNTKTATNIDAVFPCKQSVIDSDPKICYNMIANLTQAESTDMAQNFYDTISSFKKTASDIRKIIIQNVWKIHTDKQKANNTSVSSSQCVEQASAVWNKYLAEATGKAAPAPAATPVPASTILSNRKAMCKKAGWDWQEHVEGSTYERTVWANVDNPEGYGCMFVYTPTAGDAALCSQSGGNLYMGEVQLWSSVIPYSCIFPK